MRGACKWHLDRDGDAATDFLKAADLCDDEDKLAAARVRGWLLREDFTAAAEAGRDALDRFPQSLSVWLIAKNAELVQGSTLLEQDIPAEHRGEADAFQLVAWGLHRAGNISGAAELARKALLLPTASFFTRDSALAYTLENVAENHLNVAFRMLSRPEKLAVYLKNALSSTSGIRLQSDKALNYLWLVVDSACVRATVNSTRSTFKGKVLFCSNPPWLLNGMTQHDMADLLATILKGQSAGDGRANDLATSGSAIGEDI